MARSLKVLLIARLAERAGTIREHIDALAHSSLHHVVVVDNAAAHRVDFAAFDAITLHYSLVIASPRYIPDRLRVKISGFRGLKLLFIQDEYRWIDATAESIRELGIGVVFSLIDPKVVRQVYHHPFLADVRFEHTLTGFVPTRLVAHQVPSYEHRRVDVGYRARKVPAWIGSLGLQKWQIADAFAADAQRFGLKLDISTHEEDRLYGRRWVAFLANCKACLGTESGASVLDFTDQVRHNVEAYLDRHPNAEFDELRDRFFADVDRQVVMNVISPRCFEAAALRTLMVMYPGEYGGILEPGRHYVQLAVDHSNIDEVVDIIRSPARAHAITDVAYREIACSDSFSYAALTRHLDRVICEEGYRVRAQVQHRELGFGTRLTQKTAEIGGRLRSRVAEKALRLERVMLAAAKRGLSQTGYQRVDRHMRRVRRAARRLILGAQ